MSSAKTIALGGGREAESSSGGYGEKSRLTSKSLFTVRKYRTRKRSSS
jgi:hypothetical protein